MTLFAPVTPPSHIKDSSLWIEASNNRAAFGPAGPPGVHLLIVNAANVRRTLMRGNLCKAAGPECALMDCAHQLAGVFIASSL